MGIYIDLDGTLTDPFEGISNCIRYALERLGKPPPTDDVLRRSIGPPLLDTFAELVGSASAARALAHYRERFGDVGWLENVPYDGIHGALESMNGAGYRCFVATSKPRIYAIRIIEHFDMTRYFTRIYGSELDGTRSDKTELLQFARSEDPAPCVSSVMIGDRRHDMIGAVNNGLHAIGAAWGYGSEDELASAGAERIAADPRDLPGLIYLVQRTARPIDHGRGGE